MAHDISRLMADIAGTIKAVGDRLSARIDALEKREPLHGRDGLPGVPGATGLKGDQGERGADAPPVDVDAIVQRVAALIPAPKDGAPGAPGQDADLTVVTELKAEIVALQTRLAALPGPEAMLAAVRQMVTTEVAALPAPVNGKDGADGRDGLDGLAGPAGEPGPAGPAGPAGRDGIDGQAGEPGPVGSPGIQGEMGLAGKDGADGRHGVDGKDGIGLAGAVITREGTLVVTLTDGTTRELGVVVGRDGAPGAAGRDGSDGLQGKDGAPGRDGHLTDGVKIVHLDEHRRSFCFADGTPIDGGEFDVPSYAGVYKAGETYHRGRLVTWGGSMWHANKTTTAKPGDGSGDWTLCVKKGTDGASGKPGPQGPQGPRGDQGPMGPARY